MMRCWCWLWRRPGAILRDAENFRHFANGFPGAMVMAGGGIEINFHSSKCRLKMPAVGGWWGGNAGVCGWVLLSSVFTIRHLYWPDGNEFKCDLSRERLRCGVPILAVLELKQLCNCVSRENSCWINDHSWHSNTEGVWSRCWFFFSKINRCYRLLMINGFVQYFMFCTHFHCFQKLIW